MPTKTKQAGAFSRLAAHGLVIGTSGRFGPTPDAPKIAGGRPPTVDSAKRLFTTTENLFGYNPGGEHAAILMPTEQLKVSILATGLPAPAPQESAVPCEPTGGHHRQPWSASAQPVPA